MQKTMIPEKTMKENGHRLSAADIITILRIAGTITLLTLKPLSAAFFFLYALTGLTDVLDGWIARKTKTASDFGAKLDSVADLLFYTVMMLRVFPVLWSTLPRTIWYAVALILILRIAAYLTAAIKYHRFASLHTYLNKATGAAVFLIPFALVTAYASGFCWAVCILAMTASAEELVMHLRSQTYCQNAKTIFCRCRENCG